MDFLLDGLGEAASLLGGGDRDVLHAVWVTFVVTAASTLLAALVALPYGAWLGTRDGSAASAAAFALRYAMFVPTVILGLLVFSVLSRQGVFGGLDLLYSKTAIVAGEFLLAFPILGTFAHAAARSRDGRRAFETARTLGASPARAVLTVLSESRGVVLSAWLAAVARCYAELGIATTVGGNIRMQTRTLASTIQLELSRGDFARAVACGTVLMLLATVFAVAGDLARRGKST